MSLLNIDVFSGSEQQDVVSPLPDSTAPSHPSMLSRTMSVKKSQIPLQELPPTSPYKRSDSVNNVNAPWRQLSTGSTQTDGALSLKRTSSQFTPAHAANACGTCCPPPPREARICSEKSAVRSDTLDKKKRARIKQIWRLPLDMLRMARLEPLHLDDESLDAPLPPCHLTSQGEFENGLKYFIRSCAKPSNRATLRLVSPRLIQYEGCLPTWQINRHARGIMHA